MAGKNINLFLMDGKTTGRIKCSLSNWTGLVYKIPRISLDQCENITATKHNGIYFLIGSNDEQVLLYVGKASKRLNGKGLIDRIKESHDSISFWHEAVLITTRDDYFGPTELYYLENKFHDIATTAKQFMVANSITPSIGNPTEEKQCELDEFIEYSKLLIASMGYKFLVPEVSNDTQILSMVYSDGSAKGTYTEDGRMIVFEGSRINPNVTPACSESTRKLRNRYTDVINDYNILQENLEFKSPSGAASFIAGAPVNGNVYWKNEDGKTLKELLNL